MIVLNEAMIEHYVRLLRAAAAPQDRQRAIDCLVVHLDGTGQLRRGLTDAEKDEAAVSFAMSYERPK